MANTTLIIKNGSIVEFYDRYYENMDNDGRHYVGNGWDVDITDKSITAVCARKYHDGVHKIHVNIHDKKMTTELTINGACVSSGVKRCDFCDNGELGLSGGNVDQRYVYFRNNDFNDFLKRHDLLSKHDLIYADIRERFTSQRLLLNEYIYTDGIVMVKKHDFDQLSYSIKDATVIINETLRHDGLSICALRTLHTNIHDLGVLDNIIPNLDKYHLFNGYKYSRGL